MDKPVTYKLFPGLVASTDWLLEQEKQDSYSTDSTELEPKFFGLNKAKISQTINFQNVTSLKKKHVQYLPDYNPDVIDTEQLKN